MTDEKNAGTTTIGPDLTAHCPHCQPRCPHCGRPYVPWPPYYPPYPSYPYPWSPYTPYAPSWITCTIGTSKAGETDSGNICFT